MTYFNRLKIDFEPSILTFNKLTELFGLIPIEKDDTDFNEDIPSTWTYEVVELENDPYYDFINNFLDILEPKYDELEAFSIKREDISFWHFYEYEQQCNLEFDPKRLKRLGDNEITLCISCWDKN
ncbi:MAG: hypothetical protein HXX09_13775 [Bacteroidetes bacterium]|nr:hypothetical protein [Bacteroidota bacterium]